MGNNQLYTVIEQQIIGAYDLGVLTPELADVLCKAVGDSDIDSGGSMGLLSKDSKDMEDILMEMFLNEPYPSGHGSVSHVEAVDEWYDKFYTLAEERWGWR